MRTGIIHKTILAIIILYGLLMSVFGLGYNGAFYDETFSIALGHEVINGEPCRSCQWMTGYVLIEPVFVAIGDSIGGLHGARMINVLFGLALTFIVYLAARVLFDDERIGLLAAAIFVFSGQTLYLMKLATYDMIAAFFLGSAFLMFVVAEKTQSPFYRNAALFEGTIALFIASITKYLLPIFIPVFALYVIVKHGFRRSVLYCGIPLIILCVLFMLAAPFSPDKATMSELAGARENSQQTFRTLADWLFRWVALAYLFAVFGMFHKKWGKRAMLLIAFSLPIVIVHLATRAEQSVNKNMIFAILFIAPAAALGIDYLAGLFSTRVRGRLVKNAFTVALALVFLVYGYRNLKWLEKQYPDMRPVIEYFEENGFDGMNVAMNVWGNSIYKHAFNERYPNAHFFHIEEIDLEKSVDNYSHRPVDFVICEDEFYGKHCPCAKLEEYLDDNFVLLEDFRMELSWGETETRIFGRR